jgi:hypothetical protein
VESAQVAQDVSAPHEHAACHFAARGLHRTVQHGQTVLAATRPRECYPQARLHVNLTLGLA